MSDGILSQEEIDALLKVGEQNDHTNESSEQDKQHVLSEMQKDTLGEIGNISFGTSATALSTLLNQKVEITTPEVSVITKSDTANVLEFEHVSIYVNYIEGFHGQNVLVIKATDAAIISDIMLGGDGTNPDQDLNDMHLSAVQEAMNQMMGTAATSMSTVFGKRVDISPPSIKLEKPGKHDSGTEITEEEYFVKVAFELKVGELIDSTIMQLVPIQFAKELVDQLLQNTDTSNDEIAGTAELNEAIEKRNDGGKAHDTQQTEPQYLGDRTDHIAPSVQQASFSDFEQVALNTKEQRNLDMLLDIPLKVSVELGRTNRTIKEILELSSGSVVELDKLAGEPVDILVNEKLVAKGEVVVIDENFGVRVSDIISQSDRLMKIK